jgi:hypothetical protein
MQTPDAGAYMARTTTPVARSPTQHERTVASISAHTTTYAARANAQGAAMIDAMSDRDRLRTPADYTPQ